MKNELLGAIHRHIEKTSPMGFWVFDNLLDTNKAGRQKIEELWDKMHKEDCFPPKEISMADYFLNMMDAGILTSTQYQILLLELLKDEKL